MTPTLLALCTPLLLPVQEPDEPSLGVELAAVAGEVQVTFDELDEVLVWRHGRSADGVEALRSLLDLTVLDSLAQEAGLRVTDRELAARWGELEREVKQAGVANDLHEYLAQNEITPETFREHLRLSILHEALARRGLGLGPDAPLSGEQQSAWLERVHSERELQQEPHPWTEGVVARTGDLVITRDALAEHLRTLVPQDELAEIAHLLALEASMHARMPDLAEAALAAEVEAELDRRAARVAQDPQYKGVPYESLLEARGLSMEALRRDPGIRVHALSHLWFARTHSDTSVRATYAAERELFDARHGEAVDVYTLMLRGARFKNQLNPRTYDEADAELERLAADVEGLDAFRRLAGELSEEPRTRQQGGFLGRVTAGMAVVPGPLRDAVFGAVEAARTEEGTLDLSGTLLGPIRLQGGSYLLCLGERYPAPTWEQMSAHVATELRLRMRDELLPPEAVAMWFEPR